MLIAMLAVGVTGCAVYRSISSELPDPDLTKAKGRDQTTIIMDKNGKVLTRLFAEQNRQDVPLSKIPVHLRQAVIATEDKRYYEHEGVDPMGIARALVTDIIRGEKAQGGSTITQQYVKQAFVTSEKTLKRKVQEAILAQEVERRFTKDQILELYLNTIYFGHGAYGVEAASRAYFGKSVEKLTLAESAVIAGVIKSPGRYSPYLEPENGLGRRNLVLAQMLDQGFVDQAAYAEAKASPIELSGLKKAASARAPYFVEWVKEQLVKEYGEKMVYRGGLRVRTTLDPKAQAAAEKAVKEVLDRKGDPSAAVVAVRPGSGEIVAMVGGTDFSKQQFNVATQGRRQPGSAFKPFVLATALTEGVWSEKAYESGPKQFPVGSGTWKVTGASGGKKGPMRLRPATEQSVNSVYAQLILDVSPEKVVETGEALGLHEGIEPVPAIALGGLKDGVSPLEMANAYATLAAGGKRAKPYAIAEVRLSDGTVKQKTKPSVKEAFDEQAAYITTDMLRGVIKRGTGKAAAIGRPAAGKTGTTQQYRDAWFVGYTPDLACAVWVGYPESQKEMTSVHGRKVTGGSFPAEIWSLFMKTALEGVDKTEFAKPSGIKATKVCAVSGGKPTPFCPETIGALLMSEHKPTECELHKTPTEVKAPKLIGMTKEDALAAIAALKLTPKVVEQSLPSVPVGTVADQTPKPGSIVKPGGTITIVVSAGAGSGQAPTATFVAPSGVKAGKAAAFDGSQSSDDGQIVKYYWEFGDGGTAEGKTASHTFAAPGTYEVTLWVTDDSGQQASVTRQVKVK